MSAERRLDDAFVPSPVEAWQLFDRYARELLDMSGEEFLREWDADRITADEGPMHDAVLAVATMIPFVRQCDASLAR